MLRASPFIEGEAFPRKTFQLFGVSDAILNEETCHLAPTHFGVDNHRGRFVPFPYPEFRRYHPHFPFHPLPVEQVFHLRTGQIEQHPIPPHPAA